MKQRTILCLLVLFAALAVPALAAEHTLDLDPEATQVTFFLEATGHDVHGNLYLRDGHLVLDPETGTASGELTIDATRTDTGNKKRDKTMHKKVLESAEHPLIVFHAEKLEGEVMATGTSEVSIVGTVTIDGASHPLSLPATLEIDGDHWTATSSFPVPYVEWGMHDPSMFILKVAKEVVVTVEAKGTFGGPAMAANGTH